MDLDKSNCYDAKRDAELAFLLRLSASPGSSSVHRFIVEDSLTTKVVRDDVSFGPVAPVLE